MKEFFSGRSGRCHIHVDRDPDQLRVHLSGQIGDCCADEEGVFSEAGPLSAFLDLNGPQRYRKVIFDIAGLSDVGTCGMDALHRIAHLGQRCEFTTASVAGASRTIVRILNENAANF